MICVAASNKQTTQSHAHVDVEDVLASRRFGTTATYMVKLKRHIVATTCAILFIEYMWLLLQSELLIKIKCIKQKCFNYLKTCNSTLIGH